MSTTPARDAAAHRMVHGAEHLDEAHRYLDAHAAEVRAAALLEAADELEGIDFHPNAQGSYRGAAKAFAYRLRAKAEATRMAAAARPDDTPRGA